MTPHTARLLRRGVDATRACQRMMKDGQSPSRVDANGRRRASDDDGDYGDGGNHNTTTGACLLALLVRSNFSPPANNHHHAKHTQPPSQLGFVTDLPSSELSSYICFGSMPRLISTSRYGNAGGMSVKERKGGETITQRKVKYSSKKKVEVKAKYHIMSNKIVQ